MIFFQQALLVNTYSPDESAGALNYPYEKVNFTELLKVIGIRPMAPVLNTGPLEDI